MHELEKGPTCVDVKPAPVATIIDGMAMVQKMKDSGLTVTELADQLLKFSVSSNSIPLESILCLTFIARAPLITLKGITETGKLRFKKIIGCQVIKLWGSFLSSGQNKKELTRFLVSRWKKIVMSLET